MQGKTASLYQATKLHIDIFRIIIRNTETVWRLEMKSPELLGAENTQRFLFLVSFSLPVI